MTLFHEGEPDSAFCGHCKEDFPIAKEKQRLSMGLLFPVRCVPKDVLRKGRVETEFPYLCGNCWFDILDE